MTAGGRLAASSLRRLDETRMGGCSQRGRDEEEPRKWGSRVECTEQSRQTQGAEDGKQTRCLVCACVRACVRAYRCLGGEGKKTDRREDAEDDVNSRPTAIAC